MGFIVVQLGLLESEELHALPELDLVHVAIRPLAQHPSLLSDLKISFSVLELRGSD